MSEGVIDKTKKYCKNAWSEFKTSCFKMTIQSRICWGVASIITLSVACFLQTQAGHSLPGDPWSNPLGQICGAFATVGFISGSFGLLLFGILGWKGEEKDERKV